MNRQQLIWIVMLSGIAMAALSRFLPHPPNFTPIAAMALFSGALFTNKRLAFLVPIGGMLLSDTLMEISRPGYGFHSTTPYVYGSLVMIALIGLMASRSRKPLPIIGGSLLGTAIFFIVTNFGTWLSQDLYPHTSAGLLQCYTMAVPFLRYSLSGDLFFNAVLFGSYYLLTKNVKVQNA